MKHIKLFEDYKSIDPELMKVVSEYSKKDDDYFDDLIGCSKEEAFEEPGLCSTVSIDFVNFAEEQGIDGLETITIPIAEKFWLQDPNAQGEEIIKDHTAVKIDDTIIDFTLRQFGKQFDSPFVGDYNVWSKLLK